METDKRKIKNLEMRTDPIDDGIASLEELFVELGISPDDPRLKKLIKGQRAIKDKIEGLEKAIKGQSDEMYNVKQKIHKQ